MPDDGTGYGNADIKTQFNVNLGSAGCLAGTPFYLGLDGNAGSQVNFATNLLHELGHGLGFSALTRTSDGFRVAPDASAYVDVAGVPSVWEPFMFDNSTGKSWFAMTNVERQASAINPLKLAWTGANAVAGAAATLQAAQVIKISTPVPGAAGNYDYAGASFGVSIVNPGALGTLADPGPGAPFFGCAAYSAAEAAKVAGKVALVDRGSCTFVVKVKNAQIAGAKAVLVANSTSGAFGTMGGSDPTITIAAAMVTNGAGATLKSAIANASKYGSRSTPGSVVGAYGSDTTRRAGADSAGRPLLYTPSVLAPGSSVSHWDTSAFSNLLMEPNISSDLTTLLVPPKDLTKPLLQDIGW